MPLRLKTDKLGSNCNLAVHSYRLLRFGETLTSQTAAFSATISGWSSTEPTALDMTVYMSLRQQLRAQGTLPPASFLHQGHPWAMSSPYLRETSVTYTTCSCASLQSSKSQHICLPRTQIYCLKWLHAETTSGWHHGPSLVWFSRHSLCSYFFSSSSAQADHWFLEYLQHGCPQETF